MTILKKFSGNFNQVLEQLRIPPGFYSAVDTAESYIEQMDKDLHRCSYFNFKGTVNEMKARARNIEELQVFSYTQGCLDGGIYTEMMSGPFSEKGINAQRLAEAENTLDDDWRKSIRLAYVDDDGHTCAISIGYLRDDPDVEKGERFIPVKERKRIFNVAIIKDTLLPPEDRKVTFITHPALLPLSTDADLSPAEAKKLQRQTALAAEDLKDTKVFDEIAKLTNSKSLNALLNGIFDGDSISLPHFKELNSRINENRNLDNRDVKKVQLQRLIDNAKTILPEDKELQEYLKVIGERSLVEINFFKHGDFEQTIEVVVEKIESHIKRIEESNPERSKKLRLNHLLVSEATKLDESHDYQCQVMLAQATVVLKTEATTEFEQLLFVAELKMGKDDPIKISALNELVLNAKTSFPESQELQQYLESAKERSLTEPGFYDDFDKELEDIFKQINVHLEPVNTQLSKEAKLKNKLTFYAIRLEQYAKNLEKGSEEYPFVAWLGFQAEELRTLRDSSLGNAERYRNVEFQELVTHLLKQGQELQEKLTLFSQQLEQLAKNLKLEEEEYLREALLAKAYTLKGIMRTPGEAESYRDMKFTDLVSETLEQRFQRQQETINSDAQRNIRRQIKFRDQNKASRVEDLDACFEKARPIAPPLPIIPEKHGQNFWQRHRNNIIGGVGLILLTVLIVGLLASGLLAPLGVVLAAGTVTTILIVGGATVGGIAAATTAKSAYEENKWANEEWAYSNSLEENKKYQRDVQEYDNAVIAKQGIEEKRDEDLTALKSNFSKIKDDIMSKIVDDKVIEDNVVAEEDSILLLSREVTDVYASLERVIAPIVQIVTSVKTDLDAVSTGKLSSELPIQTARGQDVTVENDLDIVEKKV